jgi:hypothetical protein
MFQRQKITESCSKFSLINLSDFIIFCVAKKIKNFALIICTLVEYIIDYIQTFLRFFKLVNMIIVFFIKSSMELGLHL